MRLLLGAIAFGCLSACANDDSTCTTEARASTQVSVLDASGRVVNDATVSYSVNGSALQQCMRLDSYVCGFEQTGSVRVMAKRSGVAAEKTVEVSRDECHVITVEVALKLGS